MHPERSVLRQVLRLGLAVSGEDGDVLVDSRRLPLVAERVKDHGKPLKSPETENTSPCLIEGMSVNQNAKPSPNRVRPCPETRNSRATDQSSASTRRDDHQVPLADWPVRREADEVLAHLGGRHPGTRRRRECRRSCTR